MDDKNRVLFYRPGNKNYAIELEVFSGNDDYPGLLKWFWVIDEGPHPYRTKLKYEPWRYKLIVMENWSKMRV